MNCVKCNKIVLNNKKNSWFDCLCCQNCSNVCCFDCLTKINAKDTHKLNQEDINGIFKDGSDILEFVCCCGSLQSFLTRKQISKLEYKYYNDKAYHVVFIIVSIKQCYQKLICCK